ncbi:MAG: decaprenyl-phosphate phosphoribosyltransferase [Kiritimatiellia bacterium]|jgi:4-hydroxybenzoate polyprenyltransferase|nr:decaprenyl-phosphate phosphoribosyltransferase [Kiritimatiellia bacterium]MDP6631022.1 decaprenyl-phosphate phosphoribosyltransferase [Kiritimatiellia bacterium]MDP6809978.1 decaprenyl-phosphate phosphoribosyltransferase [Kiritimatiellia bacterium]MDP7024749.1 decaprenyl-phosphate phosphoribosyltransferase [Kiritimatiellia bacterium]
MSNTDSSRPSLFLDLLRALRPQQWTKNGLVGAAFFFAYWDRMRLTPLELRDLDRVIPAFLLFCIVSSGVYVFNDLSDCDADRHHPVKRNRPIASGRIPPVTALILGWILLAGGLLGAYFLSAPFSVVLCSYVLMQLAYTIYLKQIALLDTMIIAAGFVMRAIAGAVVLNDVTISPWLLLCTFLLAMFLALCKRRHEKLLSGVEEPEVHRRNLMHYDAHLLDLLIAIIAATTIVCYSIYTLWPETEAKFGTAALGFTIPFVIFGIFRYMDLVYRHSEGGRPEKILLTDIPILVNIVLYGLTVAIICLLRH